jgi:phospholipid/cholesterol/gamma-HCH transport system substrate-binding protein
VSRRTRTSRLAAVLVGVALVAGSCSLPGNVTGSREISATFDDVGDLVVGHSVQIADVRIGSVTGIELTDDYDARITMSIKDGLFVPLESQALLRTTSLLGEKFIELRPLDEDDPMSGTDIVDGDVITRTAEAPVGFGGRTPELTSLVEDLGTVTGTLADQTDELIRIIEAMDGATGTLAGSAGELDQLLVNLAETARTLAANRDVAVDSIRELTRLARVQNENILRPYLAQVDTQIKQVDAILAEVDRNQGQVAELLRWVSQFAVKIPLGVPEDFAQVYLVPEVTG